VAPGFIDVHSHSDELWLELPRCDGKIAQGVTTEIGGNCGRSPFPVTDNSEEWSTLDEFFARVERKRHRAQRRDAGWIGDDASRYFGRERSPLGTRRTRSASRARSHCCEQGALGASSGLIYQPGRYANTDELVALAQAARDGGAPRYASHVRNEADDAIAAIAKR